MTERKASYRICPDCGALLFVRSCGMSRHRRTQHRPWTTSGRERIRRLRKESPPQPNPPNLANPVVLDGGVSHVSHVSHEGEPSPTPSEPPGADPPATGAEARRLAGEGFVEVYRIRNLILCVRTHWGLIDEGFRVMRTYVRLSGYYPYTFRSESYA